MRPEAKLDLRGHMNRNLWVLHICGWFGSYLKDIQSNLQHEARGQSWSQRSHEHSVKMISISISISNWSYPIPSTNMQFEDIPTCWLSDLWGQLWPLASFGRSDWIFFKQLPNHPQFFNSNQFLACKYANMQFPQISDHRLPFLPSFIISPLSLFLASTWNFFLNLWHRIGL